MKDEGIIERGPRTGTHVAIRKYDHGLHALVGLKETFKGYGDIRNEVRAAMTVSAPPSVAHRLRLAPASAWCSSNVSAISAICRCHST